MRAQTGASITGLLVFGTVTSLFAKIGAARSCSASHVGTAFAFPSECSVAFSRGK